MEKTQRGKPTSHCANDPERRSRSGETSSAWRGRARLIGPWREVAISGISLVAARNWKGRVSLGRCDSGPLVVSTSSDETLQRDGAGFITTTTADGWMARSSCCILLRPSRGRCNHGQPRRRCIRQRNLDGKLPHVWKGTGRSSRRGRGRSIPTRDAGDVQHDGLRDPISLVLADATAGSPRREALTAKGPEHDEHGSARKSDGRAFSPLSGAALH